MSENFFNKPFRFNAIFSGAGLQATDLGKSISNHIELIIFTRFGEHRFHHDFGCEIWDLDFELIVSESIWEEKFRKSLLKSITSNEFRIYNTEVEVRITEVENVYPLRKITEIKKKVDISVRALIKTTGEKYFFNTALFLSPLST
ncbi:phage baseplate assembly protein W [Pedobacter sp. AK013]|uniref:GPW/gp25 family protein n=1 Tax=Pedobacter sp. AK013 TaxID=2723071 RepID=UPI00161BAF0B|nr:GPW/gp25 family protein [Pedobacter sp. AK013]MBB6240259.1 phage baseplate assembly protein W [Pedobacter sp. AK013]